MSLLTNVLKLWRTGQYLLPADSGFSPKHLFAGRVGWWLDPLDFRYARQDSAGATAYTAVEQGVGMAVDKSANGLTFVQASGPAKPVVSARVNLVVGSEVDGGITFVNFRGGTISVGALSDGKPAIVYIKNVDGTSSTYGYHSLLTHLHGSYLFMFMCETLDGSSITNFESECALVSASGATSTPVSVVNDFGGGRYLLSTIVTGASGYIGFAKFQSQPTGFKVSRWSYVLVNQTALPYQKTYANVTYATAGFPHYLKFDGAATNLVGASGGGASTAFYFGAAVQFGKVGAVQAIVSDAGTNTGFKIRTTAANQIEISAGNGAAFTAVNTAETFAAGDVAFIELFDNGTNLSACLGNGTPATVARPAVSAGTAQMTLGKANNAASEYSGVSIFSAVYLKDYCPTAAERADYKRWALQRAGVAS